MLNIAWSLISWTAFWRRRWCSGANCTDQLAQFSQLKEAERNQRTCLFLGGHTKLTGQSPFHRLALRTRHTDRSSVKWSRAKEYVNLGRWRAIIVILNREVHARWKSSFKSQRMESFDEPWKRNFIMPGKRRHAGSFLPFLPTRNTITGYYNSYEGCGWVTQRFTWELWLRSIIVRE